MNIPPPLHVCHGSKSFCCHLRWGGRSCKLGVSSTLGACYAKERTRARERTSHRHTHTEVFWCCSLGKRQRWPCLCLHCCATHWVIIIPISVTRVVDGTHTGGVCQYSSPGTICSFHPGEQFNKLHVKTKNSWINNELGGGRVG